MSLLNLDKQYLSNEIQQLNLLETSLTALLFEVQDADNTDFECNSFTTKCSQLFDITREALDKVLSDLELNVHSDMYISHLHDIRNIIPVFLGSQYLMEKAYNKNSELFEKSLHQLKATIIYMRSWIDHVWYSTHSHEFVNFEDTVTLGANLDLLQVLYPDVDIRHSIALDFEFNSSIPNGDVIILLANIVRNSIQHLADTIGIHMLSLESEIQITVMDNGTGLEVQDPRLLRRMMQKGVSFTSPYIKSDKHHGFGLSDLIARGYSEPYISISPFASKVQYKSFTGQGFLIYFGIPVK